MTSGAFLREERVFMVDGPGGASNRRGPGLVGVGATRCFGAGGGLLASGWKSIIGSSRCSQLYCLHSVSPRSSGIHVPTFTRGE